jgi:hypothetical protein
MLSTGSQFNPFDQRSDIISTREISRRGWMQSTCVMGVSTAVAGSVSFPASARSTDAQTVFDAGSHKQLFVDGRLMESSRGVTLTMNPPRRDDRILISPDEIWEQGASIGVYSSVLKEDGRIRVWYDLFRPTGPGPYDHSRRVCYAESLDGIHFEKPILNQYEVNGNKRNNVVLPGVIGGCAVWNDPQAAPEHRYKTQAKVYPSGQLQMHSSPDGLNWKKFARLTPGPGGWDTQSIVLWDPRIERYVLYTRRWVRLEPKEASYRTVRRLESEDMLVWKNESVVMQADSGDLSSHQSHTAQPPVDYYGADVFRYEEADNVHVMLAQTYWHWQARESQKGLGPSSFDVRLAVSRDGKAFHFPSRQPFMPNGSDGQFDSRFVWAMPTPVRMGDELWIYYVGSNRDHDQNIDPSADGKHLSGISRGILRLDGFVSADTDPQGGEITTKPFLFTGDRLELNLVTQSSGSVQVEVQDAAGTAITGFGIEDADSITADDVRRVATWNHSGNVASLAGKPIRLRFIMKDARLFAFQFLSNE